MSVPTAKDRPDPKRGPVRYDVNVDRTIYLAFDIDANDHIIFVVTKGHNAPPPTQEEVDRWLDEMERRAGTQ